MNNKTIFNAIHNNEFFGRTSEMEEIYQHATSPLKPPYGICLVGKRWIGKTELLKKLYHRLFWDQNKVVPIYYRFKAGYSAEDFADDYLGDFIKQYIAFVTKKPEIAMENISLNKLERLLADTEWVNLSRLLILHREGKTHGDHIIMLRNAIGAPHQATIYYNNPIFLMLDDFDIAAGTYLKEGRTGILKEYVNVLMSGSFSYLITGYTKKLLEGKIPPSSIKVMELIGLNEESSLRLMEEMSGRYNVSCDREILAVAARQLGGIPVYMKSIMAAAKREERDLETLKDFMDIYVKELVEGSIGFSLGSVMSIKNLNALRILNICITSEHGVSEEEVMEKTALDRDETRKILSQLCELYLLETSCGLIKWIGDEVAEDYIYYLYETEVKGRSIAEVKTRIAREKLKEGFYIQGARVSGRIKEELQGMLMMFNGQMVPKILFRNQDFLARYSANTYKTEDNIKEDEKISLPQIIGCFNNIEHKENGLSIIVGHGFNNRKYDDENEVVWIIGVKELPPAIRVSDAESFIRQCNIIVSDRKATSARRWMIGKEGFTGDALKRLSIEGIYTTDAVQLRILRNLIEEGCNKNQSSNIRSLSSVKEFEIVLPISTKAELVAAKAVEEIGLNMGLDNNTITQIKTALVEACINAFEHSKIKSGKVYCRFITGDDRIVIHIQNEVGDFIPTFRPRTEPEVNFIGPSKRGWGIELMKQLMDEVRFEKLKGGIKLVMVKYLKRNG